MRIELLKHLRVSECQCAATTGCSFVLVLAGDTFSQRDIPLVHILLRDLVLLFHRLEYLFPD